MSEKDVNENIVNEAAEAEPKTKKPAAKKPAAKKASAKKPAAEESAEASVPEIQEETGSACGAGCGPCKEARGEKDGSKKVRRQKACRG